MLKRANKVMRSGGALAAVLVPAVLVLYAPLAAQSPSPPADAAVSPAEFFTGRKVSLVIDSAPGGGYDTYGRLLARFFGNHLPGAPTIIVQNMPGAGGLTAVNWLAQIAPRDGATLQMMSRSIPLAPLMGMASAKFDPLQFSWIGSMNRELIVLYAWGATGITRFDDIRTRTVSAGVTGATADSAVFTRLLNNLAGAKLNIISGYPGSDAVNMAAERGETHASTASWSSLKARKPDWLRDRKINILVQFSLQRSAELPDTPAINEMVQDQNARNIFEFFLVPQEMGRPLAAPPGIPAGRLDALRKAFHATLADPEFKRAAATAGADIDPVSGEDILSILKRVYAMPPETVELAKKAMQP